MAEGPPTARDGIELTAEQRADIDGMYLRIAGSNYYELLGVPTDADRRAIRDAYFALSQKFHPDAFYGRALGPWKARIEEIFREVTRAYETLSNRNLRAMYDSAAGIEPSAASTARSADDTQRARAVSPDDSVRTRSLSPDDSMRARAVSPDDSVRARAVSPDESQRARSLSPDESQRARSLSPDQSQRARSLSPADVSRAVPSASPPVAPRANPPPAPPAPPAAPAAPAADRTGPHRAVVNPPAIDTDAARRAAREALARRMGFSAPPRPPAISAAPAVAPARPSSRPPPPLTAGGTAEALKALDADRSARVGADRASRLARLLRDADESLARNDLLGASNAYAVARAMAPEDTELAARAEQLALKLAESQVEKNLEFAREAERARQYDKAAEAYLKAHTGRRTDASLLVRAASAMLKHGRELPRAAETARRALQISPRSMEAHLVLAQIFLAGNLRASAMAVLESAQKLDPTSLVVKDLIRQCKGKA